MDWRSVTFDWNRARAFLVTAEEGSLSAAARALGLAQPTLGRQVDALEKDLGVVLFERFGRGLQLTPAGHELLAHVRAMGEAARGLSLAAVGQSDEMAGEVTISASDLYAGLLLPPILARLRAAEPEIVVTVIAENTAADLMRREADIAIRNFRPREPELVARKIRETDARFYGSPAYLERIGPLRLPQDLSRASIISPGDPGRFLAHLSHFGLGLTPRNFPVRCASYLAAWAMVKQDLGLAVIDARLGDADPGVVRALPEFVPVTFPIWLVAHREIHRNRRLRVVFDFLADALA
ncbi:LysR family transcriptional regulator [Salipiger sp. P9]|uniref:LysR family transcriptional regulator n=1 Tax=Salipiger pentaromativorans TaxID=2943193 RepID=UPI0021570DF0|nr:LysR family transcriptional regulator [Salipiger pentaromativorans]MCR8550983.1 LysR family transcriptional regulator [Salipiger pentaromativorans]